MIYMHFLSGDFKSVAFLWLKHGFVKQAQTTAKNGINS